MQIYNVKIPQFTLGSALTAFGTIIAGATRSFLLLEMDFQGRGTASADNELAVCRVGTAGTTGGTALTFTPVDSPNMTGTTPALAFSGTGFGSYATQPLTGAVAHNVPLNSNGQRYFWRANPNLNNAIVVPGGNNAAASIALFPVTGTGSVGGRLQLAEL